MFVYYSFMINVFKLFNLHERDWIWYSELIYFLNILLTWAFDYNFKVSFWGNGFWLLLRLLFFKSFLCMFALKFHNFIKHLKISWISSIWRVKVSWREFLFCWVLISWNVWFKISFICIFNTFLSVIKRSIKLSCSLLLRNRHRFCIRELFSKSLLISTHCWKLASKFLWSVVCIWINCATRRGFNRVDAWILVSFLVQRFL